MTDELLLKSIETEKIQLNLIETLAYYRLSVVLLIIPIFSFTNGLTDFSFHNLDFFNISIGILFLALSCISFIYQRTRLKLIIVETNQKNSVLIERIIETAQKHNWEFESGKNILLIKTTRSSSSVRYFMSKSGGETIYVFFKPKKILLRSLFDPKKSSGFVISSGENNSNEKSIINAICLLDGKSL